MISQANSHVCDVMTLQLYLQKIKNKGKIKLK